VQSIVLHLKVNEALTELRLGENEIGDEGAKAIGGALAVNGVLTNLNLYDNNIGKKGRRVLLEATSTWSQTGRSLSLGDTASNGVCCIVS